VRRGRRDVLKLDGAGRMISWLLPAQNGLGGRYEKLHLIRKIMTRWNIKHLNTEHGGKAPHILNLCKPAGRLLSAVLHRGLYTIFAEQLRADKAELSVTTLVLHMDTSGYESRS
jgi:hypothetical protein